MIFTHGFKTRQEAEQFREGLPEPYAWSILTATDDYSDGELLACVVIPTDVVKAWMGSK
jgi:hypothetical protein